MALGAPAYWLADSNLRPLDPQATSSGPGAGVERSLIWEDGPPSSAKSRGSSGHRHSVQVAQRLSQPRRRAGEPAAARTASALPSEPMPAVASNAVYGSVDSPGSRSSSTGSTGWTCRQAARAGGVLRADEAWSGGRVDS